MSLGEPPDQRLFHRASTVERSKVSVGMVQADIGGNRWKAEHVLPLPVEIRTADLSRPSASTRRPGGLAAGARTKPRRGLGPRWFAEGLHGDALITHLEDLQVLRRTRRVKDHAFAWSGLHQRARQWRHPADVVAVQIDLVEADNAHDSLA